MNLLTAEQADVVEAREALAAVDKDVDLIMEQIGKAKNTLNSLREQLSNMKKASEVTLEIKQYVSATTMKMGYYVDMAVREPVREIGLVEETDVWDYFKKEVKEEKCAATFKLQLKEFHEYCTGPAMKAFEGIKHIVDLTPLCQLGEEDEIVTEEETSVQSRINLLTESLENVQSWLDPFRGTHMTKVKEQEKVKAGEPEGLRHIQGVFSQGNFYTRYLAEWKFRRGKFHDLLALMRNSTEKLEIKIIEGEQLLKDLAAGLATLGGQQEIANGKLQAALAQEAEALENKNELEKAKTKLEGEVRDAQNDLVDLKAALEAALKAYRNAVEKFVEGYTSKKADVFSSSLSQLHDKDQLDS